MENVQDWYGGAKTYWQRKPSTVNGMLGGFGRISGIDLVGSRRFLLQTIQTYEKDIRFDHALDCGAGIGRVTKGLLLPLFKVVDLVEQNEEFLLKAKTSLLTEATEKHCLGSLFGCSLQEFTPMVRQYDLIWCQWVLAYLIDSDLVDFLKRCKLALRQNGLIFIKENTASNDTEVDTEDCSVTRTEDLLQESFSKAGLTVINEQLQMNFPAGLYPVRMYALK